MARHPKQDIILVGGEDRNPYIYKMDRPKILKIADDSTLLRTLPRQNGVIMSVAWAPAGNWVAVAGAGKEVNLYEAETGKLLHALTGHTACIYTLAISPDSTQIATAGFDGKVRIYSSADGKLRREFVPVPLEVSSK